MTATVTVTPTANGCPGTAGTFTITVNPTPTVAAVTPQTLCNGATTAAVAFTGSVAGTVYNWTNSDASIGLAAGGTGNIGTFTATNTGNTPVTATVTVTPTANGCPGTAGTFTITVNPTPTVDVVAPQTLCNGATTTAVTFNGSTTGTVYTWTNDNTATGLAVSGTGNIGAFTAVNTGNAPITSTVTVTPTANGCPGPTGTFTITVNPTPTVAAVTPQTLCNGSPATAIAFGGTVTGTVYNWTNSDASIGLAANGTGDIASFTATNTGTAPVTATVTVTPTANGCPGTAGTFTITVNPTPTVAAVNPQTLCNGATTAAVAFSGTVTGTVYDWTNDNTSIGLAASGTGNIGTFTAVNTGNAPVISTITVKPTANGCTGPVGTFTITVNPTPTVATVAPLILCNGTASGAVNFTGAVTGTTYNWTNSTPSIGLAASGTGNIGTFTAVNTGNTPVMATVTVTPTANGCPGPAATFTITVNPTPRAFVPPSQVLCERAMTTLISFTGPVTGTTYTWTNNNTGIGLGASGTGNIASFMAADPGTSSILSTITVTPTANGCTGTQTTFTITVHPVFTGTETAVICQGQTYTFGGQPYTATGSYPVAFTTVRGCDSTVTLNLTVNPTYHQVINQVICRGSKYRFNGVDYTQTGTYPLAFTTVGGCDSSYVINLTVQGPVASFNANPPIGCVPLTVTFNNLSAPGVVSSAWNFGNGTTGSANSPTITYQTPGTYSVSLVVADALGCKDSITAANLIVVTPRPTAGMSVQPTNVWMDEPYVRVNDASTGADSWWYIISEGSGYSMPNFTHTFKDTGMYTILQVVSNNGGCSDTVSQEVHVRPVTTFYVPNAFTPNVDDENPVFKPVGNTFSEYQLRVYNRWGEMLFRTEDIEEGWNGTYSDKPCPVDVYVYKIFYRDHRGQQQTLIGSVTLLR